MTTKNVVAMLAMLSAFWPLPIGVGYLILRQWSRFGVAFFGLQLVGLTLVRMVAGPQVGMWFAVLVYVATIADTVRLAQAYIRQ